MFVILLGGLYIEMAMLTVLGKWLEENGWSSAIAEVVIVTSDRAESISHKTDMLITAAS